MLKTSPTLCILTTACGSGDGIATSRVASASCSGAFWSQHWCQADRDSRQMLLPRRHLFTNKSEICRSRRTCVALLEQPSGHRVDSRVGLIFGSRTMLPAEERDEFLRSGHIVVSIENNENNANKTRRTLWSISATSLALMPSFPRQDNLYSKPDTLAAAPCIAALASSTTRLGG